MKLYWNSTETHNIAYDIFSDKKKRSPLHKHIVKLMNTSSTWDPNDWEIHTSVKRAVPSISRMASSSKHFCFFFSLALSGASKSSSFLRRMEVAILDSKHNGPIVDDKDYEIVIIMSTTTITSSTSAISYQGKNSLNVAWLTTDQHARGLQEHLHINQKIEISIEMYSLVIWITPCEVY